MKIFKVTMLMPEGRDQLHGTLKRLGRTDSGAPSWISTSLAIAHVTEEEVSKLKKEIGSRLLSVQEIPSHEEGQNLEIQCHFHVKKRSKNTEGKRSIVTIGENEATSWFKNTIGVVVEGSELGSEAKAIDPIYIGGTRNSRAILYNTFAVKLKVRVIDADKFNKAVKYGVGTQRTYGMGLIRVAS